ncbi:hypothetical protein B0H10DRAFT_1909040 [Mycena sp. CBHHK59/15]|nr:hypothetical protein B0H10DRAFT_1909040 [Mycena sp. CBHHK59/15]
MPTYSRYLSPNELSYFLPSRAYGLNDMFMQVIFRASPELVSPLRLRIVWAIMRLRHTLLASRIEMKPGCYDEAQFIYTPPSSPTCALEEAEANITIYDGKTGAELFEDLLNGPRKLSAERLSRLEIVGIDVSPTLAEYHMSVMTLHSVNDSLHRLSNNVLELVGGSAAPGGPPRTDAELARLLELEWTTRWGQPRTDDVIVPPAEARLPLPHNKFQEAAWKIDHENVQRRSIGGHVFPRISSPVAKQVMRRKTFTIDETVAIVAKCKSKRITLSSAIFALVNLAWIRTEEKYPQFAAPKTLPMMMYTAVSLKQHLTPITSPLSSTDLCLMLGYCNIVLPAFLPSSGTDRSSAFWARARATQSQLHKHTRSPLLLGRSQMVGVQRARRAKAFAKQDDEANGTLPPQTTQRIPAPASNSVPSAALIGLTHIGDLSTVYRQELYPTIEFLDGVGHVRKAKGGILLSTRTIRKHFILALGFDSAGFAPGVVEEFWENLVSGMYEFILECSSPLSKL